MIAFFKYISYSEDFSEWFVSNVAARLRMEKLLHGN